MNENVNESMGAIIAHKRKELGLTQEQLAGELGISYQAVSKWENELSSPDISTLPLLADLFDITIDELFGRVPTKAEPEQALIPAAEPVRSAGVELPWEDDDTLRAVIFIGHRLAGQERLSASRQAVLRVEGDALNIQSSFDVNVTGNVRGSVSAQGDVNCGAVGGPVSAGGDVDCGDVGGPVSAGGDVDCGSVSGNLNAGGDVDCNNVEGNVNAGRDVDCDSVRGSVSAGGDVDCDSVGGDVRAEGDVDCDGIADDGEFHSNLKDKKRGFSFELKL